MPLVPRSAPRARRPLVIVGSIFLLLCASGWGYLAYDADALLQRGASQCYQCVQQAFEHAEHPSSCNGHPQLALVSLVPWQHDAASAYRASCRQTVVDGAAEHATWIAPSRPALASALRELELDDDYWTAAAAIPETHDVLLAWLGASDAYGSASAALRASLLSRSLDLVERVVAHPIRWIADSEVRGDLDVRRAAWSCLFASPERATTLLRPYREGEHISLLLYACGGSAPRVEGSDALALRLARGDITPAELLDPAGERATARLRRAALARALLDAEALDDEVVLGWLRWSASPRPRRCELDELLHGRVSTSADPDASLRASRRLLAWWRERPPREDELAFGVDRYVAEVASDLAFDAATVLFARGERAAAREAFESAASLADRRCDYATWLAGARAPDPEGAPPAGASLEELDRHATALEMAGREEDAYDALARAMRESASREDDGTFPAESLEWHLAALGLRLDREPPDALPAPSRALDLWQAARGSAADRQRARRELRDAEVLRYADELGTYGLAARLYVAGRVADGFDVEVLLDGISAEHRGPVRPLIAARALAARWRGDEGEAQRWEAWLHELARLASTPARAYLLDRALEPWVSPEEPVGPRSSYLYRDAVPSGDHPLWNDRLVPWGDDCAPDVWALVPGHLPGDDPAEQALSARRREAAAARALAATYLVRARASSTWYDADRGTVTLEVPVAASCRTEPSAYTRGRASRDRSRAFIEAVRAEILPLPRPDGADRSVYAGWARPRARTAGRYRFWSAPPRELTIRAPGAGEHTDGRSRTRDVQLAVRLLGPARVDRHEASLEEGTPAVDVGAGPWIEARVVATRVLEGDRVLYDDAPASRAPR